MNPGRKKEQSLAICAACFSMSGPAFKYFKSLKT